MVMRLWLRSTAFFMLFASVGIAIAQDNAPRRISLDPSTMSGGSQLPPRVPLVSSLDIHRPTWRGSTKAETPDGDRFTDEELKPPVPPADIETSTPRATQRVSRKSQPASPRRLNLDEESRRKVDIKIIGLGALSLNARTKFEVEVKNTGTEELTDFTLDIKPSDNIVVVDGDGRMDPKIKGVHASFSKLKSSQVAKFEFSVITTARGAIQMETEVSTGIESEVAFERRESSIDLKVKGPQTANIGATIIEQITVTNQSAETLKNIVVKPRSSNGLYLQGTAATETIEELAAGKSVTFGFMFRAHSSGNNVVKFQVTADGDVESEIERQVDIAQGDVSVDLYAPPTVTLNKEGLYAIRVENKSTRSESDLELTLQIPDGIRVTKLDREAEFDRSAKSIIWTIDAIAAKETIVIQFRAVATEPGRHLHSLLLSTDEGKTKRTDFAVSVSEEGERTARRN